MRDSKEIKEELESIKEEDKKEKKATGQIMFGTQSKLSIIIELLLDIRHLEEQRRYK